MNKLFFIVLIITCTNLLAEIIAPGIEYRHIKQTQPHPLSIHIIEAQAGSAIQKIIHATGSGNSRESVSSIGKRTNAIVAINCGNYRRGGQYNGNAVGILKIDNALYADPKIKRTCLCITEKNELLFEKVNTQYKVHINNKMLKIDVVNQPRTGNEIILYNHFFGKNTQTVDEKVIELVVQNNSLAAIRQADGTTKIPKDGFVISCPASAFYQLETLTIGMPVFLSCAFNSSKQLKDIVSGAGRLIQDGKIVTDFHEDFLDDTPITHCGDEIAADFNNTKERTWLINERHPRTAIGLKKDKTLVIVVIDGRQPGFSEGMSFEELAALLLDLGCVDALNLGGGGCSTMYIKDKGVVNKPAVLFDIEHANNCFTHERPVSDAFVLY